MRAVAALALMGLLAAGGANGQSRFLQPTDLDPALVLPPPPKDDDPAAVEGRAELHRLAATRSAEIGRAHV